MKHRNKFRGIAAACALSASALLPTVARADVIQLGFILDSSGSIGSSNWTTIVNGLSSAIGTYIPVGGADVYEISIVTFSSTASINVNSFVVSDAAARTSLANSINTTNLPFLNSTTNYTAAFENMFTALTDAVGTTGFTTMANAKATYVNFATDGDPNPNSADGLAARTALINGGMDNLSIEAIGTNVSAASLQANYCYPQLCDATSPYNFPSQGFYIGIASANDYAAAIANKIQVVTGQVPEPASLALVGFALAAAGAASRRRQATHRA